MSKKEELIKEVAKELMRHLPKGGQWREATSNQQAKALVDKFNIRRKKKCQGKDS